MKLKPTLRKTALANAVALATLLAFPPVSPAQAQVQAQSQVLDRTVDANVPAQSVSTALIALSKQAGVQILMPGKQLDKFKTSGVQGRMSLRDALAKLLSGTNYGFHGDGENTIAIESPNSSSSSSAQSGNGQAGAPGAPESADRTPSKGNVSLERVVVTGSHLRIAQDNVTSPMLIITADDIQKQGLSTAEDIVRSIPQNVSNVNSAITTSTPGIGDTPLGAMGQSSANLFGLGTSATLVLVNGHRLASSPTFESNGTINLSSIPAEAIDRVEIVLDGASAIYGSDAVGGVINFIMKTDYSGATAHARADSSANGGSSWNAGGTLGTTWSSGSVLATVEYRRAHGVDAHKAGWTTSDLTSQGGSDWRDVNYTVPGNVFFYGSLPASFTGEEPWTVADLSPDNLVPFDTAAHRNGSPDTNQFSSTLSLSQAFGPRVKATLDALYSREDNTAEQGVVSEFLEVPASNPFNHVGDTVYVLTSFPNLPSITTSNIDRLNVSGGLEVALAKDWKLNLSGTYGTEKTDFTNTFIDPSVGQTENVFGNGSAQGDLSSYLFTNGRHVESKTKSFDALVDGTLLTTRAGDVQLGVGAQRRTEEYDRGIPFFGTTQTKFDDTSTALFFEGSIPLVGRAMEVSGVRSLLLSVAGRYDRYQFQGFFSGPSQPEEGRTFSKFSPRIGLLYVPVDTVRVRASWGKSFRAPALMQLFTPARPGFFSVPVKDPESGQIVMAKFGNSGNPTLQPETSTTTSLGIEWSPTSSGLTLGLTYTQFDWADRITQQGAFNPQMWPFLDSFPFLIPRDVPVSQGGDGNPDTIDFALNAPINVASRKVSALTPQIRYELPETKYGDFNFELTGVYTIRAEDKILPDSSTIQNLATSLGPDRLVVLANIGWSRGNYGANLYAHHSSAYTNTFNRLYNQTTNTARTDVASYTWFDLTGSYQNGGFTINAGVKNLLDKAFPFYDSAGGPYDPSRVDPNGRTFYLEVRNDFSF